MVSLGAYSFLSMIASADEGCVVRSVDPEIPTAASTRSLAEIARLL